MPRHKNFRRYPSYRNLQIYHALAYERRTQAKVAAQLGLSQRRVSEIGQRVREWVDSLVPARHFLGKPGLRFHLAIATERIRLNDAYGPLIETFLDENGQPRFLKRYITVVQGEPLHTLEITDQPNFRMWNQAIDVQGRLAELEVIAELGPFADVPSSFKQTITHSAGSNPAVIPSESSSKLASNPAENPSTPASNPSASPSNLHGFPIGGFSTAPRTSPDPPAIPLPPHHLPPTLSPSPTLH